VGSKQIESAKEYWLNHMPLAEMPSVASIICEQHRKNLLTTSDAMSAMNVVEKEIKVWIKTNNKIYKDNC
jgi:hypothetical protein